MRMTMTRIPHSASFTFNPLVGVSITIFYFATELANCMFTSVYPEIYMHRKIPFQKGLSWNFYQPSGTGIDLGFFEMDNLLTLPREIIFPLVIFEETRLAASLKCCAT